MNRRQFSLITVLLLLAIATLCTRTGERVAGGISEETNACIWGKVVNSDGYIVQDAIVRLRRSDYCAALPALNKGDIYTAEVRTDSLGRFAIADIDSGAYIVEVNDNDSSAVMVACTLSSDDTTNLGTNIMRRFAAMHGTADTIGRAGQRLFVQVQGLERIIEIGVDGSFAFNNLPAGRFGLRVCAMNAVDFAPQNAFGIPAHAADTTMVSMLLPAPWQSIAISETPEGSAAMVNGSFVIAGGGPDIWDAADGFHFVYQPHSGDVSITARVKSMDSIHVMEKACLMVRENLTGSSRNVCVSVEPSGDQFLHWRDSSSADTTQYEPGGIPLPFPIWIKLQRIADTFAGYFSTDGINWTLIQWQHTLALPPDVYIGLAVTSHRLDKLCTAEFDSVQISP